MKIHEYMDKVVNGGITSFSRSDEPMKVIHDLLREDMTLRIAINDSKVMFLKQLYPDLTLTGMVRAVAKNYKLKVEFTPSHLVWGHKKDSSKVYNLKTIINTKPTPNKLGNIIDYSSIVIDDLYEIIMDNGL